MYQLDPCFMHLSVKVDDPNLPGLDSDMPRPGRTVARAMPWLVQKVNRALNFESIRQSKSLKRPAWKFSWMVWLWLHRMAQYLVSPKHTLHHVKHLWVGLVRAAADEREM